MSRETMLEALAGGLRGEMDSVTVYSEAAGRCHGDVKDFFLERMEEEKQHYNWLLDYYQQLTLGELPVEDRRGEHDSVPESSPIITGEFLKRIGENQYLTTAIATAVLLEFTAMEHYRKAADEAEDPRVAELFGELARWESEHYDAMLKIQEESRKYWFDAQSFAPF